MRQQTDVLAAEFHDITGADPDNSFEEVKSDQPPDPETLRARWGEGAEAEAGLAAALGMTPGNKRG